MNHSTSFDPRDLPIIREHLWRLLKSASGDYLWSCWEMPSGALFTQSTLKKCIQSAHQLIKESGVPIEKPISRILPNPNKPIRKEKEYLLSLDKVQDSHAGKMRRLNQKETENPLIFLQSFFGYKTKRDWKRMIREWTEFSLSTHSSHEWGVHPDLEAYELLEGLLEALYIINIREERAPCDYPPDPIIQLLVQVLKPQLIFQVKHAPLNDQSPAYTDLLIIMPDGSPSFSELEPVIQLATVTSMPPCSCSLHTISHLKQLLSQGHIYFTATCSPQNLIYGEAEGLFSLSFDPRPIMEKAKQKFEAGYQKAQAFYEQALTQKENGLAAFMLQQTTELTYRALASALYGMEKKTHSLDLLTKMIRRIAPALQDIFPADTPKERKLLKLLEDAYVHGRYDPDFQVSPVDLETLKSRIGTLLDKAKEAFDDKIHKLIQSHE